jgi:hypothetical protein
MTVELAAAVLLIVGPAVVQHHVPAWKAIRLPGHLGQPWGEILGGFHACGPSLI